jgi:hypothetical protein
LNEKLNGRYEISKEISRMGMIFLELREICGTEAKFGWNFAKEF